eukprot:CAMPEP_0172595180 /NCGR_PEP_ID=MMETSP1068-20121228/14767_1 /TAXON_ID=35684 /ORGANISM="Pseudopedinella elastica, Strain CCMP716" /LENGTH=247 /DNA_ID=CAMNT_0013393613 /DNA_START=136 /DNA_END=875 /DNA_ORIENTATION=-
MAWNALESSQPWLLALEFATAQELGRVALCCKDLSTYAEDPFLWRGLFEADWLGRSDAVRRRDVRGDERVDRTGLEGLSGQDFQKRPRGLAAIGWEVRVFNEAENVWRTGTVINAILQEGLLWLQVRYLVPAPHSRWELDQRQAGPWHSRGKTRFHFLAGPLPADGSGAAASGEGPGGEGASSGTASGGGLRPNDMCGGEGEGEGGSDMQGYRSEYQRLVEDLPDVELAVIQHHTDEVLDLQFSHDG